MTMGSYTRIKERSLKKSHVIVEHIIELQDTTIV